MGLLAQSPPLLSRKKRMEIEDVSVIRAREGAVRGSGPVAGGLGGAGYPYPVSAGRIYAKKTP